MFNNSISSQLLYYRLSVLFGMPPAVETDSYKVCWETTLKHADGSNYLELGDYKGSVRARFWGSEVASQDGLKLISHLVWPNLQHTYDSTIAGLQA